MDPAVRPPHVCFEPLGLFPPHLLTARGEIANLDVLQKNRRSASWPTRRAAIAAINGELLYKSGAAVYPMERAMKHEAGSKSATR